MVLSRELGGDHDADLACRVEVLDGEDVGVVPDEVHAEPCGRLDVRGKRAEDEKQEHEHGAHRTAPISVHSALPEAS